MCLASSKVNTILYVYFTNSILYCFYSVCCLYITSFCISLDYDFKQTENNKLQR